MYQLTEDASRITEVEEAIRQVHTQIGRTPEQVEEAVNFFLESGPICFTCANYTYCPVPEEAAEDMARGYWTFEDMQTVYTQLGYTDKGLLRYVEYLSKFVFRKGE